MKSEIARLREDNDSKVDEIKALKVINANHKSTIDEKSSTIDKIKQSLDSKDFERKQALKESDSSKSAMQIVIALAILLLAIQFFSSIYKQ